MDKEILEILKRLESKVDGLESKVDRIETKLDSVVEETANLREFRTLVESDLCEIKNDMYRVELATANNWSDIVKLKAVK